MKNYSFLFAVIFPVIFWSQEIESPSAPEPNRYNPYGGNSEIVIEEDLYNTDGTFQRLANGKVVAKGSHINKVLEGSFTEYDLKGEITRECVYSKGKLHGEEVVFEKPYTIITRQYENGIQAGYEEQKIDGQKSYSKTGPYFGSTKKEAFVYIRTSSFPAREIKNGSYLREDSIIFVPNKPVEIHSWFFTKINDRISDTLRHETSILRNVMRPEYTMKDVLQIDEDELLKRFNLHSEIGEKNRETIDYYKSGQVKKHTFENYSLTYYPNGVVQDSILPDHRTLPYYHFRNDSTGTPLFRSKMENFGADNKTRLTFDYLKNNKTWYTVTSVDYRPEKAFSSNDSIQKSILNGELVDYYGTHYITKPDGTIDTSFSKLVYPLRYQVPLKQGKYYFLPDKIIERIYVLDVDQAGNVTSYRQRIDNAAIKSEVTDLKCIMQNGNHYYLTVSADKLYNAPKLTIENGELYCVDWKDTRSLESPWKYGGYSSEDRARYVLSDTLFYFKTKLLTEDQFVKALKLKSISKMPKAEFSKLLEETASHRAVELDALSKFTREDRENVSIRTHIICKVFYWHGYNPFFTEKEFENLMISYAWTKEEEREIKSILRK